MKEKQQQLHNDSAAAGGGVENGAPPRDEEAYRDRIATVDEKGKRVWIYPKRPSGRYYRARTYVSYVLLGFLMLMPFVKVGGEPLLLFNVLERRFILLGLLFTPQDFHLFGLAMITLVVFIVLFTAVFGRLFCGWVCPQTIFMEMVFRKIEYWIEGDANAQRRLNAAPWTREKILKKALKQAIFFGLSALIANVFLAYIIGVDEVSRIASEPVSRNWSGFIAMIAFSGAFYFVFSWMREQVCVAVCPYGRLQGVMLDHDSIMVTYDFVRGEPRGKLRAKAKTQPDPLAMMGQSVAAAAQQAGVAKAGAPTPELVLGDCIDCKLCVKVCPTGIDIRDGAQLECVNCTACIDACDEVMDKIGRPRGLIRYDSFNGMVEKRGRVFTPRVIAYSAVLGALVLLNVALLSNRGEVEVIILRTPGMLYQQVDERYLSNLYNYQIVNKTKKNLPVVFRLAGEPDARIRLVGQAPVAEAGNSVKGAFFIEWNRAELRGRKNKVVIEVFSGDKRLDRVKTNFLGPLN
jgi:cytochrome c oxidase accessory protein FixG